MKEMKEKEIFYELAEYMKKLHEFIIEKELNKESNLQFRFLARYAPKGLIFSSETFKEIEEDPLFLDFIIFENKISGKSIAKLFVEEHKDLPEDIKNMLVNMNSIEGIFHIESMDKDRKSFVFRKAYSEKKYTVWSDILDNVDLKKPCCLFTRLVNWRGIYFIWETAHFLPQATCKKIIAHEKFLLELRKDIDEFLDFEEISVSPRTYKKREEHLLLFYDFIQRNPKVNSYKKFNKTLIKKYLKWLNRFINISRSFIKESIVSIRKFCEYLVDEDKLQYNPAKDIYVT